MSRLTRILVIDDEPAILRTLRTNLQARGYQVITAESGEEGLRLATEGTPELVLLDLMLPDMSGLDVCRLVRAESSVPIMVLSARGEERAKVRALDLGADDYVTKPFGMDELLARMRALLRRPATMAQQAGVLHAGPLLVDLDRRQATRDGRPLELTAREMDVLIYLVRHAGKVVTHRGLLADVWGPEYGVETQYTRVFINRLRRKIEDDPAHPKLLITEPGVGYRLLTVS